LACFPSSLRSDQAASDRLPKSADADLSNMGSKSSAISAIKKGAD